VFLSLNPSTTFTLRDAFLSQSFSIIIVDEVNFHIFIVCLYHSAGASRGQSGAIFVASNPTHGGARGEGAEIDDGGLALLCLF
jgi:hypothetical protein